MTLNCRNSKSKHDNIWSVLITWLFCFGYAEFLTKKTHDKYTDFRTANVKRAITGAARANTNR